MSRKGYEIFYSLITFKNELDEKLNECFNIPIAVTERELDMHEIRIRSCTDGSVEVILGDLIFVRSMFPINLVIIPRSLMIESSKKGGN